MGKTTPTELHPGKMIGKPPLPSGHPTVDGSEIPALCKKLRLGVGNPHDFTRFIYPRWLFGISSINSKDPVRCLYYLPPQMKTHSKKINGNPNRGLFFRISEPINYVDVTGDPTSGPGHLNQIVDEVKARFHRDDLKGFFLPRTVAFKEKKSKKS